jgi:hypothetical protein
VAAVDLSLDGRLLVAFEITPYQYVWDTTTVSDGTHTLIAKAVDGAGNASTAQIYVKVNNALDNIAPTVTITSPANGATVRNKVGVKVTTSDNIAVARVELYVDQKLTATSRAAPFSTSWNATKAAAGSHSLLCKAYDAAGNVGASPAISVMK